MHQMDEEGLGYTLPPPTGGSFEVGESDQALVCLDCEVDPCDALVPRNCRQDPVPRSCALL